MWYWSVGLLGSLETANCNCSRARMSRPQLMLNPSKGVGTCRFVGLEASSNLSVVQCDFEVLTLFAKQVGQIVRGNERILINPQSAFVAVLG